MGSKLGKVVQGQMVKGPECQVKDFGIYPGGNKELCKIFFNRWDYLTKASLQGNKTSRRMDDGSRRQRLQTDFSLGCQLTKKNDTGTSYQLLELSLQLRLVLLAFIA